MENVTVVITILGMDTKVFNRPGAFLHEKFDGDVTNCGV
jgi:hypothetical protein